MGGDSTSTVVVSSRVRVSDEAVRVGPMRQTVGHADPKINLVREDGVIRTIELTCSCGEKHRIRCDYA